MKALADMKMVEVSTEAVPQLFILIILIMYSSLPGSCFGLWEGNDPLTITFLFFSILQTYTTIILSTITSINIRKGSQLDVKSKIVLGLSITCQLAARLWIMVAIASSVILSSLKPLDVTCFSWCCPSPLAGSSTSCSMLGWTPTSICCRPRRRCSTSSQPPQPPGSPFL